MFQKGYTFERVFERLFEKQKLVYISSDTDWKDHMKMKESSSFREQSEHSRTRRKVFSRKRHKEIPKWEWKQGGEIHREGIQMSFTCMFYFRATRELRILDWQEILKKRLRELVVRQAPHQVMPKPWLVCPQSICAEACHFRIDTVLAFIILQDGQTSHV